MNNAQCIIEMLGKMPSISFLKLTQMNMNTNYHIIIHKFL